jgi:hypothetical protein
VPCGEIKEQICQHGIVTFYEVMCFEESLVWIEVVPREER